MKGYLLLIRPLNLLIALVAGLISLLILNVPLFEKRSFLFLLSVVSIGAGANALNDYFDRYLDITAHPNRPIPKGIVNERGALITAVVAYAISVIGACFIGPRGCVSLVLLALLTIFYNYYLKRTPLLGNVAVSLATGGLFLCAGFIFKNVGVLLFAFIFAFLFNLGRELVKDLEDAVHDLKLGYKTLPIVFGKRKTEFVSAVLLIVLIVFTYIPYLYFRFSYVYMVFVTLTVNIPILYVTVRLLRGEVRRKDLKNLSIIMKIDMFFALLAIYVGGVT